MAYFRVGILGSSIGGEVWSINPVFDPTFELGNTPDQVALDAAAAAISAITIPTVLLLYMSTALSVTGTRLEVRDDATDALTGISVHTKATATPGTGTPKLPPQSAVVASLRTNTPGASGRGRVYWPAVGVLLGSDLRLPTSEPGSVATAMKTYLGAIDAALTAAWPGAVFDLAVRSKLTKTTPHVVRIQVGNVVDTQRRRRDSYPEAYSTVSYP